MSLRCLCLDRRKLIFLCVALRLTTTYTWVSSEIKFPKEINCCFLLSDHGGQSFSLARNQLCDHILCVASVSKIFNFRKKKIVIRDLSEISMGEGRVKMM